MFNLYKKKITKYSLKNNVVSDKVLSHYSKNFRKLESSLLHQSNFVPQNIDNFSRLLVDKICSYSLENIFKK